MLAIQFVLAGGIVTNTNQSAAWVRSMVRDASVDVDAVFFNPAGLTRLEDGFYIQINSQTVIQSRTIVSTFPGLNNDTYEGETLVPVLPTGFLAYKKGKLAISAGFTVIGGGGGANFDNGLPFFEYDMISAMSTDLAALGPNRYAADISFTGTSVYYGLQLGVSYKINDVISVGLGGRYIMAKNTYEGAINNLSYNFLGGDLTNASTFLTGLADALNPAITGTQDLIDAGLGGLLLGQLPDSPDKEQLIGALMLIGVPYEVAIAMEITTANTTFGGAQAQFLAGAEKTSDKEVDVVQKGSSFTPIISVDLSFLEGDLGIAIKYEHKASMTVKTEVIKDNSGAGLFYDEEEVQANMPGFISVGVRYKPIDKLRTQLGIHYYLDTKAKTGKRDANGEFVKNGDEVIFNGVSTSYLLSNSYEAAIGLEYDVHKLATISSGFLYTATDPDPIYHSALGYSLKTMTFGVGASLHLFNNFDLDLAYSNTAYAEITKDFAGGVFTENYDKTASIFAAGLTYKF